MVWLGVNLQYYFFFIQPGSDTDVQISPSFTTTSDGALTQFTGDERECYTCDEVTFNFY